MADWPLTSDLGPLGALPTAPRLARGFIGVVLNGWGLDALIETTELVVSELTTNVVQAVTGDDGSLRYDAEGKLPLLWVRLSSDRLRLMVEVWDTLPAALGAPAMRHPRRGRGIRPRPGTDRGAGRRLGLGSGTWLARQAGLGSAPSSRVTQASKVADVERPRPSLLVEARGRSIGRC